MSESFLNRARAVAALAHAGSTDGERNSAKAALTRLADQAARIAEGMVAAERFVFLRRLGQISPTLVRLPEPFHVRIGMWVFNKRLKRSAEIKERWGSGPNGDSMFFVDGNGKPETRAWLLSDLRSATKQEVDEEHAMRVFEKEEEKKRLAKWHLEIERERETAALRQKIRGTYQIYLLADCKSRGRTEKLFGTASNGTNYISFVSKGRRLISNEKYKNKSSSTRAFNKAVNEQRYESLDANSPEFDWLYPLLQNGGFDAFNKM